MNKSFKIGVFSLDQKVSKFLESRLLWLGFNVYVSSSFKDFWYYFYDFRPDLIIIDDSINSNYIFNFFKKLNYKSSLPVLFLTNDYSSLYETYFFEINDVIIKPFSLRAFDLKIFSILDDSQTYLSFVNFESRPYLSFYLKEKFVKFNESIICLTKTEFNVFSFLLSQKNEVCDKSKFLKNIWGYEDFWLLKSNLLEMHFSKLKHKLIPFFKSEKFLKKKKNQFLFRF